MREALTDPWRGPGRRDEARPLGGHDDVARAVHGADGDARPGKLHLRRGKVGAVPLKREVGFPHVHAGVFFAGNDPPAVGELCLRHRVAEARMRLHHLHAVARDGAGVGADEHVPVRGRGVGVIDAAVRLARPLHVERAVGTEVLVPAVARAVGLPEHEAGEARRAVQLVDAARVDGRARAFREVVPFPLQRLIPGELVGGRARLLEAFAERGGGFLSGDGEPGRSQNENQEKLFHGNIVPFSVETGTESFVIDANCRPSNT